jgi:hypothetical protein
MSLFMACLIASALIGAGARMVVGARPSNRAAKQRLRKGSTNVVDGEVVTLVGRVRPLERHLEAPLSGRTCVAFEASARLYDSQVGNAPPLYRETVVERAMVPFELVTSEGPVLVDGTSAEVALPAVPLIPRRLEREVAFLEAHARSAQYALTTTFDEVIAGEGDKLAVHGRAIVEQVPNDTAERGYRDAAPTRVRIVAHENHPLTIGTPNKVIGKPA